MHSNHILIIVALVIAAFLAGNKYGSAVVKDIEAELAKVLPTASADAAALVAKIKSLL